MIKQKRFTQGFTLLEVSIVLVVVGLLITGGVSVMTTSSDVSKYKATQTQLDEVREGLASFYTQFRRLPCPDVGADGIEDAVSGGCSSNRGLLPHVTLGMGGNGDAWGERFKYVISPKFVLPDAIPPTVCYSTTMRDAVGGKILINDLVVPLSSAKPLIDFAAFAVLSTGKNGRQTNTAMTGAFSNDGGCLHVNERERENCNTDSVLRSGTPMSDGNTIVFDDIVTWIGDMQLISLLRQTGACDVATESTGFDPSQKTNTDFTVGATTHNGDYQSGGLFGIGASQTISTSSSNDKVVITGNLERSLDLKDGDNSLLVKGSMNNSSSTNRITGGSGVDIIRIEGNMYEGVELKGGNDQLEVFGNVELDADAIDMGSGDDQIRIYGGVKDTKFELGSGTNTIYIGGSITNSTEIKSTGGTAILYYNSPTKPSSSALTLGSTVTIKCKINGSWSNCP